MSGRCLCKLFNSTENSDNTFFSSLEGDVRKVIHLMTFKIDELGLVVIKQAEITYSLKTLRIKFI